MPPLEVEAGELTAEEIIDAMQAGRRVVVTANLFGSERTLTLRHDGETYYCDTPTRLHKHDDEDEMVACIERMGYARDPADSGGGDNGGSDSGGDGDSGGSDSGSDGNSGSNDNGGDGDSGSNDSGGEAVEPETRD